MLRNVTTKRLEGHKSATLLLFLRGASGVLIFLLLMGLQVHLSELNSVPPAIRICLLWMARPLLHHLCRYSDFSLTVSSLETDQSVKSALKEITSLLNNVVERVERVESELKRNTSILSSSESSPSHRSKKQYVPTIVRVSSVL